MKSFAWPHGRSLPSCFIRAEGVEYALCRHNTRFFLALKTSKSNFEFGPLLKASKGSIPGGAQEPSRRDALLLRQISIGRPCSKPPFQLEILGKTASKRLEMARNRLRTAFARRCTAVHGTLRPPPPLRGLTRLAFQWPSATRRYVVQLHAHQRTGRSGAQGPCQAIYGLQKGF